MAGSHEPVKREAKASPKSAASEVESASLGWDQFADHTMLLSLQRTIGNQAVIQPIQRHTNMAVHDISVLFGSGRLVGR